MSKRRRGFGIGKAGTADRTRALSQQAVARKLGSTEVEPHLGVGVQDKSVVITFPQAVTTAKFGPAQARALAAALVQQADVIDPPAADGLALLRATSGELPAPLLGAPAAGQGDEP